MVSSTLPFKNFFEDAMDVKQANQQPKEVDYNFNYRVAQNIDKDKQLLAQALNPGEIEAVFEEVRRRRRRDENLENTREMAEENLEMKRYEVTPFQIFMDKAVEVLENISELDFRVNNLTEEFLKGRASVDEVSIEMTKLNLAFSFASTILSSATSTFKEITTLQM